MEPLNNPLAAALCLAFDNPLAFALCLAFKWYFRNLKLMIILWLQYFKTLVAHIPDLFQVGFSLIYYDLD